MGPDEIGARLRALDPHCREVSLSGGNPALHDCTDLLAHLHGAGYRCHVETQGSRPAAWLAAADSVTVSPKPPSSAMDTDWDRLDQTIRIAAQPDLKIVIFGEPDYAYSQDVHRRYPELPLTLQVGNHVGTDDNCSLLAKLRWLANMVLADPTMQGVAVLPQLHVLLWGNQRGV